MGASRSSGQDMVRNLIQRTGAERNGHFEIGPYHSSSWISDKLILAKAPHLDNLCRYLATQVMASGCGTPDAVIGLAPDGIALVQALGTHLADANDANRFVSLYVDEQYEIPSEHAVLLRGCKVVIVQTVIYTGKVTERLMDVIDGHGGSVISAATLITRGQVARQKIRDVPVIAMYDFSSEDRLPKECQLCAQDVPLLDPHTMLPTS